MEEDVYTWIDEEVRRELAWLLAEGFISEVTKEVNVIILKYSSPEMRFDIHYGAPDWVMTCSGEVFIQGAWQNLQIPESIRGEKREPIYEERPKKVRLKETIEWFARCVRIWVTEGHPDTDDF
jgi:hypothetical protein